MSVPYAEDAARREDLPLELADERESIRITGVWMFLVTDVLLFASLFSAYAVFRTRVAGGPAPQTLFHLGPVLFETAALLTSSFTMGLAIRAMRAGLRRALAFWMGVTLLLGALFVASEIRDFAVFAAQGATWDRSAFLSAFDLLVGAHGAHVTAGIVWALALVAQLSRRGLTAATARKVYTFALYWHFLDIVWVFIFTVVYLMAKAG